MRRARSAGDASADAPSVLHVIASLDLGGAERMLAALVAAKRPAPLRQHVAVLMPGGALTPEIRAAGVPVAELGLRRAADAPFATFRLARLVRTLRPAAIQTWMYYADLLGLWALELSSRRRATRLYWGIRCSDMDMGRYRRALRWTVAACARRAARPDAVIANSHAGLEVHRRLGYAPRAAAVIANGIDVARFAADPVARRRVRAELAIPGDATVAVHVARVDPMKDHGLLIAAATALPDMIFIAAGAGTESLAAPANVRALGLRRDIPALLAAGDIVLSTSAYGEGFANTLAEGMAAGLPAVATDVGDARLIVGETGIMVPPRGRDAVVAALRKLAEPAETHADRAARARARIVERFSLERCVAAFDALHIEGTLP